MFEVIMLAIIAFVVIFGYITFICLLFHSDRNSRNYYGIEDRLISSKVLQCDRKYITKKIITSTYDVVRYGDYENSQQELRMIFMVLKEKKLLNKVDKEYLIDIYRFLKEIETHANKKR